MTHAEMTESEVVLSYSTISDLLKNMDNVKSVTFANHSPFVNLVAVPAGQWAAIGEDYREIILEAAMTAEMQAIDTVDQAVSGVLEFVQEKGIEARALTADENTIWAGKIR